MLLRDIPGNEDIKAYLLSTVERDKIGHAQLFTGPEGCGLFPMALAYAQYINCTDRTADEACGQCSSCRKLKKLVHPDVHFSFPVIKADKEKKTISDPFLPEWREQILDNPFLSLSDWLESLDAGNKQGLIYVYESTNIIKKLSLKTFESKHRILIVWHAEKLRTDAANKLLKLIEEPPENTLIFLLSHHPDQLLGTILSRTRRVQMNPLRDEDIYNFLTQKKRIDEQQAKQITYLSSGNMQTALSMIYNETGTTDFLFDTFAEWMRLCFQPNVVKMHNFSTKISKQKREQVKNLLIYSINQFRNCLMHNYVSEELVKVAETEKTFINKFSAFVNSKNAVLLIEEFEKAVAHLKRNANIKILMFDLSIKISVLFQKAKK